MRVACRIGKAARAQAHARALAPTPTYTHALTRSRTHAHTHTQKYVTLTALRGYRGHVNAPRRYVIRTLFVLLIHVRHNRLKQWRFAIVVTNRDRTGHKFLNLQTSLLLFFDVVVVLLPFTTHMRVLASSFLRFLYHTQ